MKRFFLSITLSVGLWRDYLICQEINPYARPVAGHYWYSINHAEVTQIVEDLEFFLDYQYQLMSEYRTCLYNAAFPADQSKDVDSCQADRCRFLINLREKVDAQIKSKRYLLWSNFIRYRSGQAHSEPQK